MVPTSIRLSSGKKAGRAVRRRSYGAVQEFAGMFYPDAKVLKFRKVFQVRLEMMKLGWISRLPKGYSTRVICGGVGVALLLAMGGRAVAQADQAPAGAAQQGHVIHNSVDLGGHIVATAGGGAMYDTLVNIHSGPRVLGQTFTMHADPGTKHGLFDDLTAFSAGFGGDPNNFAKMDISKGKLYEF